MSCTAEQQVNNISYKDIFISLINWPNRGIYKEKSFINLWCHLLMVFLLNFKPPPPPPTIHYARSVINVSSFGKLVK